MTRNSLAKRIFTSIFSVVLLMTNVAFADSLETNIWTERGKNRQLASLPLLPTKNPLHTNLPDIRLNPISNPPTPSLRQQGSSLPPLPSEFGRFQKILRPRESKNSPLVIHIQDVHLNPEAQKNIAQAIDQLMKQHRVSLLGLEGVFGSVGLERYAKFPRQDVIRSVAGEFLAQNKMSGAAFAAFANAAPDVRVIGIDDETHYNANMEAYRTASRIQASMLKELDQRALELTRQKQAIFNPALHTFDAAVESFRRGGMKMGPYVDQLLAHSSESSSLSQLKLFLQAWKLESQLDVTAIERDRISLFTRLLSQLGKKEKSQLVQDALNTRLGVIRESEFYETVAKLCRTQGLDPKQFKALTRYITYLTTADKIQGEELFRDMRWAEASVYNRLAQSDQERSLVAKSNRLALERKLVNFEMTRDEWEEYRKAVPSSWFLVKPFEDFYREAEIRDQKMVENLIGAMSNEHWEIRSNFSLPIAHNVVVLVTGGFHANGIDHALVEAGYAVAVFVPKLTKVELESGTAYLNAFSQEKTPLEKLFQGEKLFMSPNPLPDPVEFAAAVGAHFPGWTERAMTFLLGKRVLVRVFFENATSLLLAVGRGGKNYVVLAVQRGARGPVRILQAPFVVPGWIISKVWGRLIPVLKARGVSDQTILKLVGWETIVFGAFVLALDQMLTHALGLTLWERLVPILIYGAMIYRTPHTNVVYHVVNGNLTRGPPTRTQRNAITVLGGVVSALLVLGFNNLTWAMALHTLFDPVAPLLGLSPAMVPAPEPSDPAQPAIDDIEPIKYNEFAITVADIQGLVVEKKDFSEKVRELEKTMEPHRAVKFGVYKGKTKKEFPLYLRRMPDGSEAWAFLDEREVRGAFARELDLGYIFPTPELQRDRDVPIRDFGSWICEELLKTRGDDRRSSITADLQRYAPRITSHLKDKDYVLQPMSQNTIPFYMRQIKHERLQRVLCVPKDPYMAVIILRELSYEGEAREIESQLPPRKQKMEAPLEKGANEKLEFIHYDERSLTSIEICPLFSRLMSSFEAGIEMFIDTVQNQLKQLESVGTATYQTAHGELSLVRRRVAEDRVEWCFKDTWANRSILAMEFRQDLPEHPSLNEYRDVDISMFRGWVAGLGAGGVPNTLIIKLRTVLKASDTLAEDLKVKPYVLLDCPGVDVPVYYRLTGIDTKIRCIPKDPRYAIALLERIGEKELAQQLRRKFEKKNTQWDFKIVKPDLLTEGEHKPLPEATIRHVVVSESGLQSVYSQAGNGAGRLLERLNQRLPTPTYFSAPRYLVKIGVTSVFCTQAEFNNHGGFGVKFYVVHSNDDQLAWAFDFSNENTTFVGKMVHVVPLEIPLVTHQSFSFGLGSVLYHLFGPEISGKPYEQPSLEAKHFIHETIGDPTKANVETPFQHEQFPGVNFYARMTTNDTIVWAVESWQDYKIILEAVCNRPDASPTLREWAEHLEATRISLRRRLPGPEFIEAFPNSFNVLRNEDLRRLFKLSPDISEQVLAGFHRAPVLPDLKYDEANIALELTLDDVKTGLFLLRRSCVKTADALLLEAVLRIPLNPEMRHMGDFDFNADVEFTNFEETLSFVDPTDIDTLGSRLTAVNAKLGEPSLAQGAVFIETHDGERLLAYPRIKNGQVVWAFRRRFLTHLPEIFGTKSKEQPKMEELDINTETSIRLVSTSGTHAMKQKAEFRQMLIYLLSLSGDESVGTTIFSREGTKSVTIHKRRFAISSAQLEESGQLVRAWRKADDEFLKDICGERLQADSWLASTHAKKTVQAAERRETEWKIEVRHPTLHPRLDESVDDAESPVPGEKWIELQSEDELSQFFNADPKVMRESVAKAPHSPPVIPLTNFQQPVRFLSRTEGSPHQVAVSFPRRSFAVGMHVPVRDAVLLEALFGFPLKNNSLFPIDWGDEIPLGSDYVRFWVASEDQATAQQRLNMVLNKLGPPTQENRSAFVEFGSMSVLVMARKRPDGSLTWCVKRHALKNLYRVLHVTADPQASPEDFDADTTVYLSGIVREPLDKALLVTLKNLILKGAYFKFIPLFNRDGTKVVWLKLQDSRSNQKDAIQVSDRSLLEEILRERKEMESEGDTSVTSGPLAASYQHVLLDPTLLQTMFEEFPITEPLSREWFTNLFPGIPLLNVSYEGRTHLAFPRTEEHVSQFEQQLGLKRKEVFDLGPNEVSLDDEALIHWLVEEVGVPSVDPAACRAVRNALRSQEKKIESFGVCRPKLLKPAVFLNRYVSSHWAVPKDPVLFSITLKKILLSTVGHAIDITNREIDAHALQILSNDLDDALKRQSTTGKGTEGRTEKPKKKTVIEEAEEMFGHFHVLKMVGAFKNNPGFLFQALTFLLQPPSELYSAAKIERLTRAYIDQLNLGEKPKEGGETPRAPPPPPQSQLSALFAVREALDKLKEDEQKIIVQAFLNSSFNDLVEDYEGAMSKLEKALAETGEAGSSFLKLLKEKIKELFETINQFQPYWIQTELKPHQKQGAVRINGAIKDAVSDPKSLIAGHLLADETRIGKSIQVLAGAVSPERNVCITAPANVIPTWIHEFITHIRPGSGLTLVTLTTDNVFDKLRETHGQKGIVYLVSLETVRGWEGYRHEENKPALDQLREAMDVLVVDEVQGIENESLQAQVVEGLNPKFFLGLSATPYTSNLKQLYRLMCLIYRNPKTRVVTHSIFRNKQTYREFLRGGWRILPMFFSILTPIMTRRRRRYFGDMYSHLGPVEKVGVSLSFPQAQLLLSILKDLSAYLESYNRRVPEEDRYDLKKSVNYFLKRMFIDFTVFPTLLGETVEGLEPGTTADEATWKAMDTWVLDHCQRLGKGMIVARNKHVVSAIVKHYQQQGLNVLFINSDSPDKEDERRKFQEDPSIDLVVLGESAGVGIRLDKANWAFYAQVPIHAVSFEQSSTRGIGFNVPGVDKEIPVGVLVPTYAEGFVDTLSGEDQIYAPEGKTPWELLMDFILDVDIPRLRLVMDGVPPAKDQTDEAVHDTFVGRFSHIFSVKSGKGAASRLVPQNFYAFSLVMDQANTIINRPLRSKRFAEVVDLVRSFNRAKVSVAPLGLVIVNRFKNTKTFSFQDIPLLKSMMGMFNKPHRAIIVSQLAPLYEKTWAAGYEGLDDLANRGPPQIKSLAAKDPELLIPFLIACHAWNKSAFDPEQHPGAYALLRTLNDIGPMSPQNDLTWRLTTALTVLMDPNSDRFLVFLGRLKDELAKHSAQDRIALLESLAVLKTADLKTYNAMLDESKPFEELRNEILGTILSTMMARFDLPSAPDLVGKLESLDPQFAESAIMMMAKLLTNETEFAEHHAILREVVRHVLDGTHAAWRNEQVRDPQSNDEAPTIEYKKDEDQFWKDFTREENYQFKSDIKVLKKKLELSRSLTTNEILSLLNDQDRLVECFGKQVAHEIMEDAKKQVSLQLRELEIAILKVRGVKTGRQNIAPERLEKNEAKLKESEEELERLSIRRAVLELRTAINDNTLTPEIANKLSSFFSNLAMTTDAGGPTDLIEVLTQLQAHVPTDKLVTFQNVRVEITSNPTLFMRRGMLGRLLETCVGLFGADRRISTSVDNLASRNKMLALVYVTQGGKEVLAAMSTLKMRAVKNPDGSTGTPTIYIELHKYSLGYDFVDIIASVVDATKLSTEDSHLKQVAIARQTQAGDSNTVVLMNTGNVGPNEFFKPLFQERRRGRGEHHGTIIVDPLSTLSYFPESETYTRGWGTIVESLGLVVSSLWFSQQIINISDLNPGTLILVFYAFGWMWNVLFAFSHLVVDEVKAQIFGVPRPPRNIPLMLRIVTKVHSRAFIYGLLLAALSWSSPLVVVAASAYAIEHARLHSSHNRGGRREASVPAESVATKDLVQTMVRLADGFEQSTERNAGVYLNRVLGRPVTDIEQIRGTNAGLFQLFQSAPMSQTITREEFLKELAKEMKHRAPINLMRVRALIGNIPGTRLDDATFSNETAATPPAREQVVVIDSLSQIPAALSVINNAHPDQIIRVVVDPMIASQIPIFAGPTANGASVELWHEKIIREGTLSLVELRDLVPAVPLNAMLLFLPSGTYVETNGLLPSDRAQLEALLVLFIDQMMPATICTGADLEFRAKSARLMAGQA